MADESVDGTTSVVTGGSTTGETAAPPIAEPGSQAAPPSAPRPAGEQRPSDDRNPSWLPTRLKEERERVERRLTEHHQRELAARDAAIEQERRRVAALAGVSPQDPQAAEREQIRSFLRNVFKDEFDAIDKIKGVIPQVEGHSERVSGIQARQAYREIEKHAAARFGGTVPDPTKRILRSAFVDFMQYDADDATWARYEDSDPTLFEEFVKSHIDDGLIGPLRRQLGASTVSQGQRVARLPSAGTTAPVARSTKPLPTDDDEVYAHAWEIAKTAPDGPF